MINRSVLWHLPKRWKLCGITMPCVGMCCRFPTVIGEECAVCNGNRTAAYRQASPHSAFFAPSYQEVKRIDGKFVNTQRPLLFNYVFVRASERDVFQLMQRFSCTQFPASGEGTEAGVFSLPFRCRNGEFAVGGPVLIPIHFLFIYPSRMVCARATGYALPRDGLRGWRRLLSFSREPVERM